MLAGKRLVQARALFLLITRMDGQATTPQPHMGVSVGILRDSPYAPRGRLRIKCRRGESQHIALSTPS